MQLGMCYANVGIPKCVSRSRGVENCPYRALQCALGHYTRTVDRQKASQCELLMLSNLVIIERSRKSLSVYTLFILIAVIYIFFSGGTQEIIQMVPHYGAGPNNCVVR